MESSGIDGTRFFRIRLPLRYCAISIRKRRLGTCLVEIYDVVPGHTDRHDKQEPPFQHGVGYGHQRSKAGYDFSLLQFQHEFHFAVIGLDLS